MKPVSVTTMRRQIEQRKSRIAELEAALRCERSYSRALEQLTFSANQDPALVGKVKRAAKNRKRKVNDRTW